MAGVSDRWSAAGRVIFFGLSASVTSRLRTSSAADIRSLDGVRGLAVLLVLLAHTKVVGFDGQGAIGVFLFFSLSGFLLTLPLQQWERATSHGDFLRRYFIRRLFRIVPFYYLVLTVLWLATERDLSWFVSHLMFLAAEDHLWSIRQELLFYLILPALFATIVRFRQRPVAILLILGVVGFAVQSVLLWLWSAHRVPWPSEPFYPAIFLYGVLVCALRRYRPAVIPDWVGGVLLLLLLCSSRELLNPICGILGAPLLSSSPGWLFPNLFGMLCAGFVLSAADARGMLRVILEFPLLRLIGVLGYSMYLLHWYIFRAIFALGVPWGLPLFLATFAATLAASCLTFTLIERPLVEAARRLTAR